MYRHSFFIIFLNILSISNGYIKLTTKNKLFKYYAIPKLPDLSQKEFPQLPPEDEMNCNYDLVVIGSGPGGEAAAVQAAKYGARVAVIEKKAAFGGPTGLTSKAVREATKRLCAAIEQIGGDKRKQIKGLWKRKFPALRSEAEVLQAKESRDRIVTNNIDLYIGSAEITDTFPIPQYNQQASIIKVSKSSQSIELRSRYVCIATGSRPYKPSYYAPGLPLDFTKNRIVTATEMGNLIEVPNAVAILGGGIIAVEYATVLAKLGVGVSLICKENDFLPFLESELRESLKRRMRRNHVLFVYEKIKEIEIDPVNASYVKVTLYPPETSPSTSSTSSSSSSRTNTVSTTTSGSGSGSSSGGEEVMTSRPRLQRVERKLKVDLLLFSNGREANSENLGLEALNCTIGKYGRIGIDANYRTSATSEIYAIGDVIGPPGLASAAQYQARRMADHLFKHYHVHHKKTHNYEDDEVIDDDEDDNLMSIDGLDFDDDDNDSISNEYDYSYENEYETDSFFTSSDTTTDDVDKDDDDDDDDDDDSDSTPEKSLFGSISKTSTTVPLTLWTIPEIASVGISKLQAMNKLAETSTSTSSEIHTEYIEGYAYFKDMARGRLSGDMDGFLKIVTEVKYTKSTPNTSNSPPKIKLIDGGHKIIGVFIFGEGANELIQLGSILVNLGTTVEEVSRTPFAAVTLCGLFQMACDDALQKIRKLKKPLK